MNDLQKSSTSLEKAQREFEAATDESRQKLKGLRDTYEKAGGSGSVKRSCVSASSNKKVAMGKGNK